MPDGCFNDDLRTTSTARSSSSGSTSGHGNKQKSCLMRIKLKRTHLRCLARVRPLSSLGSPALLRAKQRSRSQVLFQDAAFDHIASHHSYDSSGCERNQQRDIWSRQLQQKTSTTRSEQREQSGAAPLTVNRTLVDRSAVSELQYQHTTSGHT